ncbi:LuxR C-terminal-related transcriptional regulator [Candidatus Woesearchaeota archaeon]|nr:LuxR C-terminal-related transcriptional regulator [Candidatus Woesearchaeota archaeon]
MLTKKEIQVLELRKKGLKQIEVANSLKITQAAVSKFETNALSKIKEAKRTIELIKKMNLEIEEDYIP